MFWKKKKVDKAQESKIILGMVMLQDEFSFHVDRFNDDFTSHYGTRITKPTGDSSAFVFRIEEETVAIGHVEAPIPLGDIEGTAQYAYNWISALDDIKAT